MKYSTLLILSLNFCISFSAVLKGVTDSASTLSLDLLDNVFFSFFVYVPSTSDFDHVRSTFHSKVSYFQFTLLDFLFFFFSMFFLCIIQKSPNSNNLTFYSTRTSPCTFSQGVPISQYN